MLEKNARMQQATPHNATPRHAQPQSQAEPTHLVVEHGAVLVVIGQVAGQKRRSGVGLREARAEHNTTE